MDVNDDDHQELEALETLSLADFALTKDDDDGASGEDHHNHRCQSPPLATDDVFEFCSGRSSVLSEQHTIMSHAEDMISGGKLKTIPNLNPNERHITHRGRSESMRELKTSTNKGPPSQLVRNSYSLDYKKLNRSSKLIYDPTADNNNNNNNNNNNIITNRNSLGVKSSSSRWSDLVFAPMKAPPEMDLRGIRNRQFVQNNMSNRSSDHRKTSWGVLGFLSCRSSGSVAVTMPMS